MPKLALKIDCMNTESKVRPGTMKAPKLTPCIADMRDPSAEPNVFYLGVRPNDRVIEPDPQVTLLLEELEKLARLRF